MFLTKHSLAETRFASRFVEIKIVKSLSLHVLEILKEQVVVLML